MPLSPQSTGFSKDGLSYEVAGDYNKLLGMALDEYKARATNPQGFWESDQQYQQRVDSAAGILGNMLAPLGIGNSLAATVLNRRASQPRIVKSGQDILMEQPGGQGLTMVHQGTRTPAKMSDAQKWEADTVRNDIARTQKLIDGITGNEQSDIDNKFSLENRLVDLKRKGRSLFALPDLTQPQAASGSVAAPPAAAGQPPAPPLNPYMFMGTPGGANLIQQSLAPGAAPGATPGFNSGTPAIPAAPPQAGVAQPGSRGILPKELVSRYLGWAHGDRSLAEKMAIENGYVIHY